MTHDARSKVLDRIRKLQQRRTARGFTEAEALQAAEVAAALMREHELTEADLVIDRRESVTRYGTGSIRAQLWAAIAVQTNATVTFQSEGRACRLIWIGLEPGPEIAVYLQAMLDRAVNRELAEFRKSKFYRARRSTKTRSQAAEEFVGGLIGRLIKRLREMFRESRSEKARQTAIEARDRALPGTRTIKAKDPSERFPEARDSGWSAGGRVGLHHGVGTDEGPAGAIGAPRLRIEGPR